MFQSTHPRGVRLVVWWRMKRVSRMFQSTHPRGVRRQADLAGRMGARVSIHAPAWGATERWSFWTLAQPGFNPRTRVGCDKAKVRTGPWAKMFQSTHPRGVRPLPNGLPGRRSRCFNPRTRVGCDDQDLETEKALSLVSIHAPAWGATFCAITLP